MSMFLLALLAAAQPAPPPPAVPPPAAGSQRRPALPATRGMTPATSTRAEPEAALQDLATLGDYPATALAQRQSGRVAFRLAIGADGRVAGCVILGSSGSSALDSATCRLLRARARFTPARDAAGNPVADEYFGQLAWRLPR